jgi:hypothetical protein
MQSLHTAVLASTWLACLATNAASAAEKVTVGNFTRAETVMYMSNAAFVRWRTPAIQPM